MPLYPPVRFSLAILSFPSFLPPRDMAGYRHFGRRRLLSMTLFWLPLPCGQVPQKAMTAALCCGGLSCLFRPRLGGHLKRKRHIMTTNKAPEIAALNDLARRAMGVACRVV